MDQIKAIVAFLEDPRNDERGVEDVAKRIVDGFYGLLLKPLKDAPMPIKAGAPFKCLTTGKIHCSVWNEGDLHWVITSDSKYGYLGSLDPWRPYAIDTTGKAPTGNAKGWLVGDTVGWAARGWGKDTFKVIAIADKGVLLRPLAGRVMPESNEALEKYYKKIPAPLDFS